MYFEAPENNRKTLKGGYTEYMCKMKLKWQKVSDRSEYKNQENVAKQRKFRGWNEQGSEKVCDFPKFMSDTNKYKACHNYVQDWVRGNENQYSVSVGGQPYMILSYEQLQTKLILTALREMII